MGKRGNEVGVSWNGDCSKVGILFKGCLTEEKTGLRGSDLVHFGFEWRWVVEQRGF